jgi:hypothetical protein
MVRLNYSPTIVVRIMRMRMKEVAMAMIRSSSLLSQSGPGVAEAVVFLVLFGGNTYGGPQ